MEPLWREGSRLSARLGTVIGVVCRTASGPLQRVLTDFGADHAFGRVPGKLKEHYGIEMPASTIRRITERHAERCLEKESARTIEAKPAAGRMFIGEIDGCMVPVVETAGGEGDQRKNKQLSWKEARLCLVRETSRATPVFGGNFQGGPAESGRQWARCARLAGFGPGARLHAVGDGALWIAEQVEAQFGAQGRYLVDFYHLSEYLGHAAPVCAPEAPDRWLETQQAQLKSNRSAAVLTALEPFVEPDENGPVAACRRYLQNRTDYLDYQGALAQGLPIGSGEIESAHRYVIQERLKLPGAWWKIDTVKAMLALRIKRANGEWDDLWPASLPEAA